MPIEAVVGTARNPSQNTAAFLPLPQLRGKNWESRWQRIQQATRRLAILPPVELLKLGDEYWVVDGHNRIAAALQAGAVAVDADVTELLPPGTIGSAHVGSAPTSMVGSEELRQAGEGRFSPTTEVLRGGPSRVEIARSAEAAEAAEAVFQAGQRLAEEEGAAEEAAEAVFQAGQRLAEEEGAAEEAAVEEAVAQERVAQNAASEPAAQGTADTGPEKGAQREAGPAEGES